MTISDPEPTTAQELFGRCAQRAFLNLESKKRGGHRVNEVLTLPQGRTCQSCGAELALKEKRIGRPPDVERRWLGRACLAKHENRDWYFWLDSLRNAPGDGHELWPKLDEQKHLPYNFNQLAEDHDLGLVVADADGTGRILKQLSTSGRQAWADFSRGLDGLSRESLTCAINEVVPEEYLRDLFGRSDGYLPVLPLFCGGDDFVIACRGDIALPLASSLCRHFAAATKPWCPGQRLGLSAAVVVTRPGFPFRIAHRIATGLLQNAKREAKRMGWSKDGVGAIDYALITESMGNIEAILADRTISSKDGKLTLQLSGRPYRCADAGVRSIGALAACVEEVRNAPRGKLHELRSLCSSHSRQSSGKTAGTNVPEIREQMEAEFADWVRRTARRPDGAQVLSNACVRLLGSAADAEPSIWLPREGEPANAGEYRTQWGDLADALRLFGSLARDGEDDDEVPA